jgi:hypothetical protein
MLLILAAGLAVGALYGQRRKAHKLRATSLVELTTDASGKTRAQLIPLAILDEGRFHDAGIYRASPWPFALQQGVVYEVQQTGTVLGYVTVQRAVKRATWTAQGDWQPATTAKAAPARVATPTPDDRPILRRPGSAPAAAPTTTPASSTGASGVPPASEPVPPQDSDRPVIRRPSAPAVTPTPTPASSPTAPLEPTPTPTPDPNRPLLRRGVPERPGGSEPKADEGKAGAAGQTGSATAASPVQSSNTRILVGISDDQPLEQRSYEFTWKPGEQTQVEARMRKLALAQLPRETPALTEASLKNVTIRGFDLDLTNDAVMVITAEVAGKSSIPGQTVTHYVTVIARVDFEGNPQKLAASVADSSRLDVAPRLELIDAADVDGDAAAELIFRQYDYDQKSYVIYSVGRNSVSKVFEGASTPLK